MATVEKVVTEDQASKGTACTVRICIQLADQVQQVVAGGAEGQDQGGQDGGSLILIASSVSVHFSCIEVNIGQSLSSFLLFSVILKISTPTSQ